MADSTPRKELFGLCVCDTSTDTKKCVICQSTKRGTKTSSGDIGRKRIWEAAEVRDDHVHKRLKALQDPNDFCYHNDNECYKKYTRLDVLTQIKEHKEDDSAANKEDANLSDVVQKQTRTSDCSSRNPPNISNPSKATCIICGSVKEKANRGGRHTKFRLCEARRAQDFIDATKLLNDDVRMRVADINTVSQAYAADLYCHNNCMKRYLYKYTKAQSANNSAAPSTHTRSQKTTKRDLFQKAAERIDTLIKEGYALSLSDIK